LDYPVFTFLALATKKFKRAGAKSYVMANG